MDDYDLFALQALDFAPLPHAGERLALLTLQEAHDRLRLLVTLAEEGGPLSQDAGRLAKEIAARV
ncbi:DUF6417 family protein, partial [Streptomyces sp. MK7]